MRKFICHSFLLRWSIGVFLLAASHLPSAVGQSIDVPANIYVTNILSCGTSNFLNPQTNYNYRGGYDFFITGGYIIGNAAADVVPGCGSYPAPPGGLSGSVSVPSSGTTPSTPITSTAELTVDAYFNTPSCSSVPSGDLPLLYAPYSLSGYLFLANGETYYLYPTNSGSVIPAGSGDPNFPFPTYPYVFGPNSVTHTEIPSVISVNFQCTNSGTLPPIQISYVSAYTSSPNPGGVDLGSTRKAELYGFTYEGPISLLVRSGNAYTLTVDYKTGSDPSSDLISWPPYVFSTSGLVLGCSVVTNSIGLNCSSGSPLGPCPGSTNSGATIKGGFGMKNEFNWENTFFLEAYNGPVGNYRYATFTPLASAVCPPYYTFTAINVVPSDFFVNQGVSDQPYYLYGYLSFGTYSDFEFFQAPTYVSVEAANCTTTNLDVFELCPGHVQGNINLTGPTYGPSPRSPWLSLILDNTTFGSTRSSTTFPGGDDVNDPYLNPNSYSTSSSIGATGGSGAGSAGNGSARVLFHSTGPTSGDSTLSGSYDLRLAGLSSVTGVPSPSTWNPNQINLNFYAPDPAGNVNMQESVQITDNTFINQTITCGVTNNHDISYCFGENDWPLVDTDLMDTPYARVSISGYNINNPSYSVSFTAIGVVINGNGTTIANEGLFRLFLPEGQYSVTTTVIKPDGGTYNQLPRTISVSCDTVTTNSNQNSPVVSLIGPDCYCGNINAACVTVNIISPTNDTIAVSYTVNGGASVAVCTTCGGTIPVCFPISPGANTLAITVTDLTTGFLTVLTKEVTWCPAPPIVTCPASKTVQFGSGWTFDLPVSSSCCGSNVTITSTSTVTNGSPCQPVITRTWQFTDACGNSNTCSQTVTVISTGPCQFFNTGMSGTNAVAGGTTDPNFVLVSVPTTPAGAGTSALVMDPSSIGGYMTDGPNSQWIGPNEFGQDQPEGVYHYQVTFLLCCTNGAEMSGQVAMDNTGGVYLNNNTQVASISGSSAWSYWTQFTANSGFVPGLNTLDIYVTNNGSTGDPGKSQTGMRAEVTVCVFPFLVYCPTNKTVPCDSNWTFDPPTASSCCSSNVTITPLATVTNGTCPHVITQTWRVTDGCSNRAICSQTVTVVPTPPILTCSSNKTVSGGLAWSFDPPTASHACCSNLTTCVLNIVTNASCNPCALNYTCTWRVTDCCTNAATCSQTVTVIPTSPCQVFNTGMNGPAALSGGAMDPNFNLVGYSDGALVINPADVPGSYLPEGPNSQWIGPDAYSYDESYGVDHYQLQFLLCCTNGAELSGQMAADNTATVYLNGTQVGSISPSSGFTSWTPIFVSSGFVVCPLLNVLDIYVTNYFILGDPYPSSPTAFRAELTNCITPILVHCPGDKGVQCGSMWTFDQPTASSCCGSNVVTTVLSTVTNGVVRITFTGGGSAANGVVDFVGNTATSGFLDITAGTNMGTYILSPGSGSNTLFVWDGLIFPTSNPFLDLGGLLFTNGGVEINLYGNGPGSYALAGAPPAFEPQVTNGVATLAVCPHMITRTWLVTDACGNSNTCSQTVTVTIAPPVIVCSTNKTIPCTSNVVFDLPTVVSACCGTNYSISTFGNDVTTNAGPDTYAITRTWLITDCCGNSNFCSQTVMVQDTTLYMWTTLAGLAGNYGSADGTGSAARFEYPSSVAVDSAGNVYVADSQNFTIRKVTPAGVVTTLAGLAGSPGSADGTGSAARFLGPRSVAVDSAGNVYVADEGNSTIRKVTPAGVVTTLAGLAGSPGSADGTGSAARFNQPPGVAVDSAGNVYVADVYNSTIRKVTPAGVVTTLAGLVGSPGNADGTGSTARFKDPNGVAADSAGNVYVADEANETIRKVTPAGVVTTLGGLVGSSGSADGTGSAARFNLPYGVAVDSAGNLYVADYNNYTIRKGVPTPCPTNPCPLVNTIALNTGFDQTAGTVYTNGAADAFWWVTRDPTVPATTLPRPATVILRNPAWQLPQPNSQWISSYPTEEDNLNGEYDFETYFCLTANASNVVVSVCLRADDAAGAYLNGHQITLSPADTTFKAASPACGTASMGLNPTWFLLGGQNVLQVRVTNIYAVAMGLNLAGSVTGTGLSVETASCCRPASGISGQKFHDLNGNGVRDPGEPARAGWTINLSGGATAVTDVNGYYYFQNLAAGTYTVTEVPQSGWTQTAPAGGSYTVTLGVSQQVNGRDFGNYRTNDTNCVHIFCPSNIVAECTGSGAVVPFTVTATSLCTTNPPVVTCTPPSTTLFPVGSTLVHCTAEDSLGDWATCSFTVTVQDTTPPVITCPSNIVIVTCSTNVPVGWSVTATDMCSSVTVTSSPPSGTIFHRDTTNIVTVVATDGSGNTNTCSFLVIVRKPTLNIAIGGSGFPVTVTITWLDGGTLLQADSVLGPWTDIPLATSPYTTAASASQKFYRLRCP